MKLSKAEQDLSEWQTAVGCLIGAEERRCSPIGFMVAQIEAREL
jgi:hypothetical protein